MLRGCPQVPAVCKQCVLLYLLDPPEHYAIGSVLLPSEAHQTNRVREGELFFFLKVTFLLWACVGTRATKCTK
jgi:hypothetical protein